MMLRLSINCGVVTARKVRGVLMYGSDAFAKLYGTTFGKLGFASPCVNKKRKRESPAVNSFTTRGEKTCLYPSAKLRVVRSTVPSGGKPGNTCGRPFRG